ncbi:MAG TPA: hypothetical protein VI893_07150, partial [Thermoplasmata archaeon]|nr:hypothetical protein [Thermoplasmata archaeon]
DSIGAGQSMRIPIGLMPKESGSVPLRADCRIYDAVGGMNTVPADLWIEAGGGGTPTVETSKAVAASTTPATAPAFGESQWRDAMSTLPKAAADFENVPVAGRVLFDTVCDLAQDLGMRPLEPKVSESQGFFRGVVKLHSADLQDGAQIEVTGSGAVSKVLFTAYSSKDPGAAAKELEAQVSRRFDLTPFRKS